MQSDFLRHFLATEIKHRERHAPKDLDTFLLNKFVRAWGHLFIYDEKTLRFALADIPTFDARDPAANDPLGAADLIAILDTAERHRLGAVGDRLDRTDAIVIDHHPPVGPAIADPPS